MSPLESFLLLKCSSEHNFHLAQQIEYFVRREQDIGIWCSIRFHQNVLEWNTELCIEQQKHPKLN